MRKKSKKKNDDEQTSSAGNHEQATTASTRKADIFARMNRGTLLDVLVFVANIFLMRLLTRFFIDAFRQASEEDTLAKLTLGFACLGMFVLPPAGAILKRWHYHRRLDARVEANGPAKKGLWGCLCNP